MDKLWHILTQTYLPFIVKFVENIYMILKKHHGESEECVLFAIASISGRALLFHALLSNGAVYYRLPISAFFPKTFF
jgi:ABC-type antimicrobial peptide transport system permease subunit